MIITADYAGKLINMNIWIDLGHTPQYNFYKQLIIKLIGEGHYVYVTVLNRGRLASIVQYELKKFTNVEISIVGTHKMNKFSAIIEANLLRLVKMFLWARAKHIDLVFSNGYIPAMVGYYKGIRCYTFDDDPQTFDFKPKLKYSTQSSYCIYEKPIGTSLDLKAIILPVLKEWAYLAPKYFIPNKQILQIFGVTSKQYIFLREVSVGTVNYAAQASGAILNIVDLIPKDKQVLFSLEDKSKRNLYPKEWHLLQEPVEDIHSLIYYSAGLISSGDSMAREASLLGVPAYYLGVRHSMPANLAAAKVASFHNETTMPFEEWVHFLSLSESQQIVNQSQIRTSIENTFIDINQYMYDLVTLKQKNNV